MASANEIESPHSGGQWIDWKSVISGLIGAVLLLALTWLFGLIGKVQTVLVPTGAIIAFTGTCPSDGTWREYTQSRQRVLRGTPDEEHLGEHGGSDSYVLLEGNLPKHRHRVHGTDHNNTPANTDYTAGEYGSYLENYGWTDYAGKENPDPVPIVPSYVNVQFCIKNSWVHTSYRQSALAHYRHRHRP